MLVKSIESKVQELKKLYYSKSNIQVAVDLCLDIKNDIMEIGQVNDFEMHMFIKNWKISIDNFAGLLLDDEELKDTPTFWQDAIEEMEFDVNNILRHVKNKYNM